MIELSENISNYIRQLFGEEFLGKYKDFVYSEFVPYIRISSKADESQTIDNLNNYGIKLEKVESVNSAYKVIGGKEIIGKTLDFILGKYYIQGLSSMMPPIVLNPTSDDVTLDLAAAPGSKSTQIADMMLNRGTLVLNEPNLNRVKGLIFNLDKMGIANAGVIKGKGELLSKTFENYFDKILTDVPCSGLGIVQKKGEVSSWWNQKQMEKIAELQLRLLISAVKMAKVGGEIVYSTCTMTIEENEFVIDKVLKNYPVEVEEIELPVISHEGFTNFGDMSLNPSLKHARRIVPWEIDSEGFFVCKLRKTGETAPTRKVKYQPSKLSLISPKKREVKKYIDQVSDWFGIPVSVLNSYNYLKYGNNFNFAAGDWESGRLEPFLRIGSKFGIIDKRDNCHLNYYSARILAKHISENVVELSSVDDLKLFINGAVVKKEFSPAGQKIVKFRGDVIGTGIAYSDGLKSQFPRAIRTQEIVFPES